MRDWAGGHLDGIPHVSPPPPPGFEPYALKIVYFDIYGTLIDNESGIFNALAPLLSRCPYRFERAEALSFYFESESGVKERNAVPYSEILALAHTDMSKRLGLVPSNVESSVFASSIVHWPLVDGAVECLQQLRPWIPALVALSDTDHETLQNTAAFSRLGPYFAEVFTWDASHRYRPDIQALAPSFLYHDAMGVLRGHRCLVSSGLFQDLEVACRLAEVPVIWMRYPASLAVNLDSDEASFAWTVCDQLPALVSTILREKCRAIFRNMDHCL
ncbi:HAD-like domain-containing protein [Mycena latifolia]|nr:HAD-like domain-containing protein [Mycena latifolia]